MPSRMTSRSVTLTQLPLVEHVQVRVVRDGSEQRLSVFELLVGDVLVVETGDIVPTDGVVIEGSLKWVCAQAYGPRLAPFTTLSGCGMT